MKTYWKIVDGIMKVLEGIAMAFLASMVVIVFYAVIMRYLFSNEPSWTDEVILLLMVAFSFIGMAMGMRDKLHIAIELFVRMMPKKLQWVIELINSLLIIVCGYILSFYGWQLVQRTKNNVLPTTGISTGWRYIVLPIVGIMLILIVAGQIVEHIRDRGGNKDGV